MSADLLRRAAESMRREEEPVFDALADLLEYEIKILAEFGRTEWTDRVAAVAEAYLADPGDVPSVLL